MTLEGREGRMESTVRREGMLDSSKLINLTFQQHRDPRISPTIRRYCRIARTRRVRSPTASLPSRLAEVLSPLLSYMPPLLLRIPVLCGTIMNVEPSKNQDAGMDDKPT